MPCGVTATAGSNPALSATAQGLTAILRPRILGKKRRWQNFWQNQGRRLSADQAASAAFLAKASGGFREVEACELACQRQDRRIVGAGGFDLVPKQADEVMLAVEPKGDPPALLLG